MSLTTFRPAAEGTATTAGDYQIERIAPASSGWPPTVTPARGNMSAIASNAARSVVTTDYQVRNTLLQFDTMALAGKTLLSANLIVHPTARNNADGLMLVAQWYAWDGASDTDHTNGGLLGNSTDAHAGTLVSGLTLNADNSLALTNLSNVNRSGATKLRLLLSALALDAQPTGANSVTMRTIDYDVSQIPNTDLGFRLVVESPPAAPTGLTATVLTD